jgi:hypothetical protein
MRPLSRLFEKRKLSAMCHCDVVPSLLCHLTVASRCWSSMSLRGRQPYNSHTCVFSKKNTIKSLSSLLFQVCRPADTTGDSSDSSGSLVTRWPHNLGLKRPVHWQPQTANNSCEHRREQLLARATKAGGVSSGVAMLCRATRYYADRHSSHASIC